MVERTRNVELHVKVGAAITSWLGRHDLYK